jgi:hypothetical protein
LWVHYYDPHYSYEPHPGFDFGNREIDLYDGEIAFTDSHIGRLLEHLRQSGLYDKTVVVVTGDHGEGFGEHGVKLHGYHLYSPQTKVPLIVRVPGVAGRRSTTSGGHVDILPTLVNLAGGQADADMQGSSLLGPVTGADRARVVYQQLSYENNHEMRAAADATCHVIYNVSPDTSWEVYRVDRDPLEEHDLSGEDECADTREALVHYYDTEAIPPGAGEALLPARPTIANPLDADLGDSVRLLACDTPHTAKPGESVPITWTFEARDTVEHGWKVFVHVEKPGGGMINADHFPARPFDWWKPGQYIRYTTTVALPASTPRGRYVVKAGLYHAEDKRNAQVTASHARVVGGDTVECTSFEVAP